MGLRDVTKLAAQLDSVNVDQQIAAAEALAYMAEEARPAAVSLTRAVGDDNEEVREWVNSALEELGPPDVADADVLAGLLHDQNQDVRYWAATLLGRLEGDAAKTVPQLASILSSQADLQVRERAAWALGKIGPSAVSAVDELRKAADSNDARLARLANDSLDRIQQSITERDEHSSTDR
jgi:HEAT repeat protein